MSWRTIYITRRAKLELRLNHLVVRSDETLRIPLDEIGTVIIDSTAVSVTVSLLSELTLRKIKVILCDTKHNPVGEIIPYYGSHDTSKSIRQQIAWKQKMKDDAWQLQIIWKLKKQNNLLHLMQSNVTELMDSFINEVEPGDATNREGHAAKIYFHALWGNQFIRGAEDPINAALNYGYSLLLSLFNKEVVARGYITQLGIWHNNQFNPYNFSSDLMEPFRPIIDRYVFESGFSEFTSKEKLKMLDLLQSQVLIGGKKHYLPNAVSVFTHGFINMMNHEDKSYYEIYSDL